MSERTLSVLSCVWRLRDDTADGATGDTALPHRQGCAEVWSFRGIFPPKPTVRALAADPAEVKISATGHSYGEWKSNGKNTHPKVCSADNDKVTEAHSWDSGTVSVSPSCAETGIKTYKCDICNESKQEEISATGHKWDIEPTVDKKPTCTEDGAESIHCKNCEVIKDSRVISANGHDYETVTIKANLKSNGLPYYLCRTCQHKDSERTVFKPVKFTLSAATYTYNAKTITPAVVVRDSQGLVLKKGADYDISYASGRKNVGRYAVKMTFKGEYEGTKKMYFTISPKAPTIKTPATASKSFTTKWSKVASQATGYQIMYASNSKFTSGKKTVNVGNYKTTSKKITKLKSKSKYYVRVRTYKTVNGTKYYSEWSKVKTVKTK